MTSPDALEGIASAQSSSRFAEITERLLPACCVSACRQHVHLHPPLRPTPPSLSACEAGRRSSAGCVQGRGLCVRVFSLNVVIFVFDVETVSRSDADSDTHHTPHLPLFLLCFTPSPLLLLLFLSSLSMTSVKRTSFPESFRSTRAKRRASRRPAMSTVSTSAGRRGGRSERRLAGDRKRDQVATAC